MASSSPDAGYNQSSDGDEKLTSETEFSAEEGIYEVEKIVGISKQDVSVFHWSVDQVFYVEILVQSSRV